MKLEYKLSVTSKAIIDYPSDTPVYELISKYNERKKEQIKILKEVIIFIIENIIFHEQQCLINIDVKYEIDMKLLKSFSIQLKISIFI